jgi:hypothetical protein
MINQKLNKTRLEKYAMYLKRGKLKGKDFFIDGSTDDEAMEQMKSEDLKPLSVLPLLELPFIFKDDWFYSSGFIPFYKNDPKKDLISSMRIFFGINKYMFEHLFSPGYQSTHIYGGKILKPTPSTREIADNILALLEAIKHFESIEEGNSIIYLN